MENVKPSKTNRRWRKWVLPKIQCKIIIIIFFITLLTIVVNNAIMFLGIWLIQEQLPAEVSQNLVSLILKVVVISIAIAFSLSGVVGILASFRVCGPIFRFRSYFEGLFNGRWDSFCSLRENDDLQDVKNSINNAVRVFVDRLFAQIRLLNEARGVLQIQSTDEEAELIRKIEREILEFQKRFGENSIPPIQNVRARKTT